MFSLAGSVRAAELINQRELSESLNLTQLNRFLESLDDDVQKLLPRLDPASWDQTGPKLNINYWGQQIGSFFLKEIIFNLKLAGQLLLLAAALAILQNLRHAFEAETVSQLAFGVCFLVVMGLVFNSFRITFAIARETVEEMNNFMYAISPVLFSLITAGGGVTTATIVHPLLMSSVGFVGGLINTIVLPLILFGGALGLVDHLVEGFNFDKIAGLFKTVALGLLGLAMAIFIGLITIRGFAASVADTTALRTAKYFSNTFLPVVGGVLADTMEMTANCSLILKGGLGIYGLIVIVLIVAFPLAKILAVVTIYQLTGALIQPLGSRRLADALQTVSGTFLSLFGAVAVVALMFFITLAILMGALRIGMG